MKNINNGYSIEVSENVISMLNLFARRDLADFPLPCLSKWIGGKVLDVKRGSFEFETTVRGDMTNPAGYLHGGTQCAMIDDAMGWASATLGYEKQFLSTNLSIDYLGTAMAGDIVTVRAWIFREGSSILHVIAEIRKQENIIAKAQSNIYISNREVDYKTLFKFFSKNI